MPGIHVFAPLEQKDVDGRDKPGHDEFGTPHFHSLHFESVAEKLKHPPQKFGLACLKAGRRRDTVLANFQLAFAWEASR